MFSLIYFDTRICFYLYLQQQQNTTKQNKTKQINNFQNFLYNIYDKLRGDDITNSLI